MDALSKKLRKRTWEPKGAGFLVVHSGIRPELRRGPCDGLFGFQGEPVEPLIRLRNLEKSIESGPNRFFLLRRITLDVQPGEFVTIMGPSGAGKSTLLSIIGMLDGAWSGEYNFLE